MLLPLIPTIVILPILSLSHKLSTTHVDKKFVVIFPSNKHRFKILIKLADSFAILKKIFPSLCEIKYIIGSHFIIGDSEIYF